MDIRNKRHTAGVMFMRRVVESLWFHAGYLTLILFLSIVR
ncbi:hypothetical protein CgS9114_11971 [Corynebacterium glutamicum S9114]|nr:hypothetical protein CgS9114_11971 [Corynebacterium glutamicum S9114]